MPAKPLILVTAALLTLTGCESRDGNAQGTDITINAKDENGSDVAITADGDTGKVGIKLPGFDANIALPKTMLDSSNFEIDGVKLYPGSKVTAFNVNGDASNAANSAAVRIAFTAPDAPTVVRDWFVKAFAAKSIAVTTTPTGLSGKNADGAPFTMTLTPGATGTTGQIMITDAK